MRLFDDKNENRIRSEYGIKWKENEGMSKYDWIEGG